MIDIMPYLEFRDGRNVYALLCPACRAEGEIGVRPDKARLNRVPQRMRGTNSCSANRVVYSLSLGSNTC